jgi:DNA-binding CsgD family transcriptional regulator
MRLIRRPMLRHSLLYGTVLACLALLLELMDFRHLMHQWSTEFYVLCVALLFASLGIWLGNRLTPQPRGSDFELNTAAIAELGISAREVEVLGHLAEGASNKLIARRLDISPNTVKTHISRLFEKLDATNRTEAIAKARGLDLLP